MPAAEDNAMPSAEDPVICRCEDVTLADITAVLEQIGDDASPTELKRRLRAGMGWCQGRVCGPALAQITGGAQPLMRSRVVRPVLISRVADAEGGATA